MRVKCSYNNISAVDKKLHNYAFDQDDRGDIDITLGKIYDVYGLQENALGTFYLVLTDELNSEMPWWMPSGLYEVEDSAKPVEWIKKEGMNDDGKITVYSYPIYFEAEEDIEDSTDKGYEVFAEMKSLNSKERL